jgi:DNA-binding XRE family transcriptional regulator
VAGRDRAVALEIGARIRQARKEAGGMTQGELGDLIGVTERSIQAYEQGDSIPYKYGNKLEAVLGRPVAWFWYGDEALQSTDDHHESVMAELKALRAELRKLVRKSDEMAKELGRLAGPA